MTRRPLVRALVSAAALAVMWLAARLALPGIDPTMIDSLRLQGEDPTGISIVSLGVTPVLSGFLVVELAALVMPRWRPLRHGGPSGRSRLRRASVMLGLALAALQGWFLATWLSSSTFGGFGETLLARGLAPKLLVVLTLMGGVGLVLGLVRLVDHAGLGNGFSVLLGGGLLAQLAVGARRIARMVERDVTVESLILLGIVVLVVVTATRATLRAHTKRLEGAERPLVAWRLPTSGLVPLTIVPSISMLALQLAAFVPRWLPVAQRIAAPAVVQVVGAALAAMLFSLLFNRLAPIVAALRRIHPDAGDPTPAVFDLRRAASRRSLFYVVGLALVAPLVARLGLPVTISVLAYVPLVAIVMDLADEWRFRAEAPDLAVVWPLHRVALVEVALEVLRQHGIAAFPRGANHRALMHFFGPYVPIELCVPTARAAEAEELLGRVLAP